MRDPMWPEMERRQNLISTGDNSNIFPEVLAKRKKGREPSNYSVWVLMMCVPVLDTKWKKLWLLSPWRWQSCWGQQGVVGVTCRDQHSLIRHWLLCPGLWLKPTWADGHSEKVLFISAVCRKDYFGIFPGGPLVKTLPFKRRGVRVRSLVRELRSHVPCSAAKTNKQTKKTDTQ